MGQASKCTTIHLKYISMAMFSFHIGQKCDLIGWHGSIFGAHGLIEKFWNSNTKDSTNAQLKPQLPANLVVLAILTFWRHLLSI